MKLQLLREFVALAEMLNFTKAANRLYMTQPVLSRHIKELEASIGTELLIRDTHRVALTSAGEVLFIEAKKILQQYDDSIAVIHRFTGKSRLKLSIVYLGDAFSHLLSGVVSNFKQKYPDIATSYHDAELDDALNLLSLREYDVGFVLRPNFLNRTTRRWLKEKFNFNRLSFQTDPLCIAVNKHHQLAAQETISLKELENCLIIREDPKRFLFSKIFSTDVLLMQGLDFKLYKEYPNLKTCAFNLEINKDVVLLIPKHRAKLLGPNSTLINIKEDYHYIMELIWDPRNPNSSIPKFVKEFERLLAQNQQLSPSE
ncbi:LysR family transcriptional regulator [Necropsobacter rosorum]|uniref:LysR family transcriptional regulator n=1 Tax=Necropsobacter rosorum TaxID=908285 RepID=UPI0006907162